jgi:GTP-binding protein
VFDTLARLIRQEFGEKSLVYARNVTDVDDKIIASAEKEEVDPSVITERYGPYKGPIEGRKNGVLISNGTGDAVTYALGSLEERGILMIDPGEQVYEGMIVGENAKPEDLDVNPLRAKQLTNFRASGGKDDAIRLTPPRRLTLEQAVAYIDDDELVEVTPKSIRLRKRYLDPHERKRASRAAAVA